MDEKKINNTILKLIKIFAIFCMSFVILYSAALSLSDDKEIFNQKQFFIISAIVTLVILTIIFIFINLSPKKDKKNILKNDSGDSLKFKDQIKEKLTTYKKDPLYINLSLTIKDTYSLNFDYDFTLNDEKINEIFDFIYSNINSDLKENKDEFLLNYEKYFQDYDLKNAEIVMYFSNLIGLWEKIQNLIFKKLDVKNNDIKNITNKVWNLFMKNYINAYSPATLKRQKGQVAIQIYKNLLYEILQKNSFQTAENLLENTNKEKRRQVIFEIYNSPDKELLEVYFYNTFYVGSFLKSWQKKQILFEQDRLFYDTLNFIFKQMLENYIDNPIYFSSLSQKDAKNLSKTILKTALYESGFVPFKTPLRNGLEILTYDNTPEFLGSFDFYLDLFCYKFKDKKVDDFKQICQEILKNELNLYNANWLLQKDGEFGKKLFYQILPIALNKI
ncbi:hypothetical protein [Campylobacter ureolyticus]|uniref:hypothetical protein n=1 Tax=Campylobacter ureolyticus TaxID=827 RepID=UPI0022B5A2B8|nr:hypothetical protein [Campylobacter ureolyticus]MCZ6110512.1 hypothetical protein [Campylobacter ureolyticus]